MQKIIITGASGLLGSNMIKTTSKDFELFGIYNNNKVKFNRKTSLLKIDLTKREQLSGIIKINPDLIIHCAAYTNVDGCEKNPDLAHLINVEGTRNILEVAKKTDAFLIHISTDAVFDGKKGNYSEKDNTNPINAYAKSKLEAEEVITKEDIDSCIVRTTIYGWNKLDKFSLAEWMINKFESKLEFSAFYDVIFSPILTNNLTPALFEIYKKKITGILNVAGSKSCSKYEFAQLIADVFSFDKELIKKTSIDEIGLLAKRAKNLSLNVSKAQKTLDTKLLDTKQGLKEMKRLKDKGYVKELKNK